MAIIRLSVVKRHLYAPYPNGDLDRRPRAYDRTHPHLRCGLLDTAHRTQFSRAGSDLIDYLEWSLETKAANLPASQPIVIMANGFLFEPRDGVDLDPRKTDNPHGRVFHFMKAPDFVERRAHTTGWPRALGFAANRSEMHPDVVREHAIREDDGENGLVIAFGWMSFPNFLKSLLAHGLNFYAKAHDWASVAGWYLADLINALSLVLPGRRIDIMGHSLGTVAAMSAIAELTRRAPGQPTTPLTNLDRIILMGSSEYAESAFKTTRDLARLRLPQHPTVYNFTSRTDRILDILAENLGPSRGLESQVLGHNGLHEFSPYYEDVSRYWMDMRLDGRSLRAWFRDPLVNGRGQYAVAGRADGTSNHWHYFTEAGNLRVYRDVLFNRDLWSLPALRAAHIPEGARRS